MSVLLIAGSPSARSRTAALLQAVGQRLSARGASVQHLQVRDLAAQALLQGDVGDPSISQAAGLVALASVIVIATPVYKAAYSGVLKAFLDLLPQDALKGKTVLPMATGGSPNHMLAVDYAVRPVLQALGAEHIRQSIYAVDAQIALLPEGAFQLDERIAQRLDEAVDGLLAERPRPVTTIASRLAATSLAPARCSA